MAVFWTLVLFIIFFYTIKYITDRNGRIIDKTFPGPFRMPIIGNLYYAVRTPESVYNLYLEISKWYNYKTFRIWSHEKPYIFIPDYKVAKIVLSSNTLIDKAPEYRFLEPWVGKGIGSSTGEIWKKNRKLITPAFHFQILHKFFKTFDNNADVLCEKISKHVGKEAFDVYKYVTLYALDTICDSSMGVKINAQNNSSLEYVRAVKKMTEIFYMRVAIPWLKSDWFFQYTSTGRLQKKVVEILKGHSTSVIRKKKEEYCLNRNNNVKNLEDNTKEKTAFLHTLLEIGDEGKLTDEEIRAEVDTIMFAGHDTMTSSISLLLYALAEHQDVQEKVYQELREIFETSERCPTFNDVNEMKYMEQFIKETQRFYTVAPIVGRTFNEDFPINDKQVIPKGTTVIVFIAAIHRDPEIWPNPEAFDPDRFLPEACKNRHPFAFLPFSAGPRNCIGQKFAIYQMKITICKILRKFKLTLSDDPKDKIRPKAGIILTSVNGMMIKVQSRNAQNE